MKVLKSIEVVSGLGAGGAEKALQSRLNFQPKHFETVILNLRPQIDVIELPPRFKVLNKKSGYLGFFSTFKELLDEFKPDFVIVRTPMDAIRIGSYRIIFWNDNWKIVFESHSNFVTTKKFASPFLSLALRFISFRISSFIAVSENVLRGPLCRSNSRARILYLGADIGSKGLAFEFSTPPRLLFLGRLARIKNPLQLVNAIEILNQDTHIPNGFLTIVGDGDLRDEIEAFVSLKNLQGKINVLGFKKDVVRYLEDCTHLVSVSSNEGLPISFFEAKLSGMRIISTPSGGGSEIFDDYDFELPSFQIEDLVDHLRSIIGSEITSESRTQIAKNSVWMQAEECSKKYYELLESLAD